MHYPFTHLCLQHKCLYTACEWYHNIKEVLQFF